MSDPTVVESIEIAAPAELVYGLITDVARMGEWSPEATGARVKFSGRLPEAGDRFTGTNKRGFVTWSTPCTVQIADEPTKFEFAVGRKPVRISTWTYELRTEGDVTVVTEAWTDDRGGPFGFVIKGIGKLLIPASRIDHNRRSIKATLSALKVTAEKDARTAR
jgi:uncharacterized protein YndB with AHSA1/START domain